MFKLNARLFLGGVGEREGRKKELKRVKVFQEPLNNSSCCSQALLFLSLLLCFPLGQVVGFRCSVEISRK